VENICAKREEVIRRWKIRKMEGFSICTLNLIFLCLPNHGGSDRQVMYHELNRRSIHNIQGGSNTTGTDLYVNKPHCAAAVRPSESEATTSTFPPARVRTCSVLYGIC